MDQWNPGYNGKGNERDEEAENRKKEEKGTRSWASEVLN
mgnify:CR=1 FL=1